MFVNQYLEVMNLVTRDMDKKPGYQRNFTIGQLFGIQKMATADENISASDYCQILDFVSNALGGGGYGAVDIEANTRFQLHARAVNRIVETLLAGVADGLTVIKAGEDSEYEAGVIDGLLMYCDLFADCPDALREAKEVRNKILYKNT